ncbi:N(2)-fixation sustaining protein CowN [Consotaella aegiceratis]|uniref:N(2)-fixation sustaining protein CowN n=1 Tax=Consotaella aegiceratis TaxID=3097961 RepID=UPI002F3E99BF
MENSPPDRYVSFKGIDCDANARAVIERVLMHIEDPEKSNAYWEQFKAKLEKAQDAANRQADELCLLCAAVSTMTELFEEHEDEEGLAILHKLEVECC